MCRAFKPPFILLVLNSFCSQNFVRCLLVWPPLHHGFHSFSTSPLATFKLAAEFVLSAAASSAVLLENVRAAADRALAAQRRIPMGSLPPCSSGCNSSRSAGAPYRIGWVGQTSFDPHSTKSDRLSLAALLLVAMRASVLAEARELKLKASASKERISNAAGSKATLSKQLADMSAKSVNHAKPYTLAQLREMAEPGDDRVDERGLDGKLPRDLDGQGESGKAAALAWTRERSSHASLSTFELHTRGEGLPALAARVSGAALTYAQKAAQNASVAMEYAHRDAVASRKEWAKKLPKLGKHEMFQSEVRKAFSNPFSLDPAVSSALEGSTELELKDEALRAANTTHSYSSADSALRKQQRDDTIVGQMQTYHKLVTTEQITPAQALTLSASLHGDFKKTAAKNNLRAGREPIYVPLQSRVTREVDFAAKRRAALETAEQLFGTLKAAPRLQFAAVPGPETDLMVGAVHNRANKLGTSVAAVLADGREMWEMQVDSSEHAKFEQDNTTMNPSEKSRSRFGSLRCSKSTSASSSIDKSAPLIFFSEKRHPPVQPGEFAKVNVRDGVPTSTMERFVGKVADERSIQVGRGESGDNGSNDVPALQKQPPQRHQSKLVRGASAVMHSIRQVTLLRTQETSTSATLVFRLPNEVYLGRSVLRLKLPRGNMDSSSDDDDDVDDDDNAGRVANIRLKANVPSAQDFGMCVNDEGPAARHPSTSSLGRGMTPFVNYSASFDSSPSASSMSRSKISGNTSKDGVGSSASSSGIDESTSQSDNQSDGSENVVVASAVEVPLEGAPNAFAAHAACRHTTARALFRLGAVYRNGTGMPFDANKAVECWRMAAELGHSEAQNNLGVMYASGNGAAHNDQLAVKMYSLAAGQGVVSAQFNLACMLAEGRGAPAKDEKTAVALWSAAAANNHLGAHFNLGVMFEKGRGGLNKELLRAIAHYTYAAERGHRHSCFNLGFLYEKGGDLGTGKVPFPPFPALAEYYYALAAQAGDSEAGQRLEQLRKRRFKATSRQRRAAEKAHTSKKLP